MPVKKEVYVVITVPKTTRAQQKGRITPGPKMGNIDTVAVDTSKPGNGRSKRRREPVQSTDAQNKRQKVALEEKEESIVVSRTSPSRKGQAMSREDYLRADPYADVQSPTLVVCRLCGTEVKLSSKGTYGPNHWNRHIKRCKSDEEVEAKTELPAADEAQKKCSTPRKRIRVSPGTSPLKLKISRKTRIQDSVFPEQEIRLKSDPAAPVPALESEQSEMSYDRLMTPSNSHEEPSILAIYSPSATGSPVAENSLLDEKELSRPELQWIDGLLTTSPQGAVFQEDPDDGEDVTHSDSTVVGSEPKSGEETVANVFPTDHNVVPSRTQDEEKKPDEGSTRESSPPLTHTEHDLLFTESSPTTSPSPPPPPDQDPESEAELDLEYPEWDPPPVQGTFEQELRKSGILSENVFGHYAIDGDMKSLSGEPMEAMPRMVAI